LQLRETAQRHLGREGKMESEGGEMSDGRVKKESGKGDVRKREDWEGGDGEKEW
jgi:hypothetical protein